MFMHDFFTVRLPCVLNQIYILKVRISFLVFVKKKNSVLLALNYVGTRPL